jgi:hypothetical protein
MSLPPQPGQWGPGNPPRPGPPQGYQPPPGPPQQPPGYYPQPGWGPPPPKQSNSLKWLLIAVAALLVIAITVGVTLFFTRGSGGGGSATPTASDIASANDTGPVAIITFEPTCPAWISASKSLAQVQQNGWGDRDAKIPASNWTAEQRSQYEAVAKSLRQAADQTVTFARQTPNRVMRELYGQFVVYSRMYADSIPQYTAPDDSMALASVAASIALDAVCNSITYGSAVARSNLAPTPNPPSNTSVPADLANPPPLMSRPDPECGSVTKLGNTLVSDLTEWSQQDPSLHATQWTSEQQAASKVAATAMTNFADGMEAAATGSSDSTFQDLTNFASIYSRAYVKALPTYVPADNLLFVAGTRVNNVLISACEVAEH